MSRPDCVEFCFDSINDIDPIGGGQYGKQLRVSGQMSRAQVLAALRDLLGGMPEPDAYQFLRGEFPEWFQNAAPALLDALQEYVAHDVLTASWTAEEMQTLADEYQREQIASAQSEAAWAANASRK